MRVLFNASDLVIMGMAGWLADSHFIGDKAKIHFRKTSAEIMGANTVHVDHHAVDVGTGERCEWRQHALAAGFDLIK